MIKFLEIICTNIGTSLMCKEVEERLRQSEKTAQALLNASTEAMTLTDVDGIILSLNQASVGRFAWVAPEWVGKPVHEFVGKCRYDLFPLSRANHRRKRVNEAIPLMKSVRFEDRQQGRMFDQDIFPLVDKEGNTETYKTGRIANRVWIFHAVRKGEAAVILDFIRFKLMSILPSSRGKDFY